MKWMILKAILLAFVLTGFSELAFATTNSSNNTALPATLRSALYGVLAKDAGANFHVKRNGCANLPEQSLSACFDSGGVNFRSSGMRLTGLRLVAFGRENNLVSITPTRPIIDGNRVSYSHGALSEWWRVLPIGFEHGFTIARRPGGKGQLALKIAANRVANPDGQGLSWGRLHYGKLVVTDADGKVMPARMGAEGRHIVITVNDERAVYPLTVDPLVWIDQKVTASDGAAGDKFGLTVALDGNTALVGALDPDAALGDAPAAVYVFTLDDGKWREAQKLVTSDGAAANFFGISLALDGNVALIGAPAAAVGTGGERIGAVYVFTRTDDKWSEVQRLVASDGTLRCMFGLSVALDGNTALIGAPYTVVGGNPLQGVAYIFSSQDGNWSEVRKLAASDGAAGNVFGVSVALDSGIAFVGASGATIGSHARQGAVYVFTEANGSWGEGQKIFASDGATGDLFGISVALDNGTALIGADGDDINDNVEQGSAYVFNQTNDGWSQTQKLALTDGKAYERFGIPVSLDGHAVLIGAAGINPHGERALKAYLFTEAGGSWSQAQKFVVSDGVGGLALDGGTALIGSQNAVIDGKEKQGAAHFYGRGDLGLALSAPGHISPGADFVSQVLVTNAASTTSPAVAVTMAVPAAASFVSANATQGQCSEDSGVVSCALGSIAGNAGMATTNITLKAAAAGTIQNTASVARATPALTASASTAIAENNPPVAEDGSLTTSENKAASGTLQATDPDDDALTFAIVNPPAHGQVTLDDPATGAYSYTPNADYVGSDSFTFKASDGEDDSTSATITITVEGVEPPPDNDSGGGSIAPFGLLILAFAALAACVGRRRKS